MEEFGLTDSEETMRETGWNFRVVVIPKSVSLPRLFVQSFRVCAGSVCRVTIDGFVTYGVTSNKGIEVWGK